MSEINHVAIIMDGNGRWAKSRFHPREWGHIRGAKVVSEIVQEADNLGVKCLTLFCFSTENWIRPKHEISILFKLLKKFLKRERANLIKNNVQFGVIGDYSSLPIDTLNTIEEVKNETSSNTGLKLTFAFNYGSRKEIVDSVNKFIEQNPESYIKEEDIDKFLYTHELGDVDLLIRTSGELRISNFLLWQLAYAELFFTPTKWPDFNAKEFRKIIQSFSVRERRFGGIGLDNNQKELS